ncbi:MAG TPA: hypothetical protein VHT30_12365 [Acidimicrobiales bacterium]|nr:hypothetical protein [Acidimicrobiales bacterium]
MDRAQVSADAMGVPEGTLTVSSGFGPTLRASAETLEASVNAFAVFDTAILAERTDHPTWWAAESLDSAFSSGRPFSEGGPHWISAVSITLYGVGDTIMSATLTAAVGIGSNRYQLDVSLDVVGGRFRIHTWAMSAMMQH